MLRLAHVAYGGLDCADGTPFVYQPEHFAMGLAVDVERKGGRVLLVPSIKQVDTMDFAEYWRAYEEMVRAVMEWADDPESGIPEHPD